MQIPGPTNILLWIKSALLLALSIWSVTTELCKIFFLQHSSQTVKWRFLISIYSLGLLLLFFSVGLLNRGHNVLHSSPFSFTWSSGICMFVFFIRRVYTELWMKTFYLVFEELVDALSWGNFLTPLSSI